jgi:ComF family protein
LYNDDLCQGDSCFYKSHHYNSIISIIAYNDIGKELIGKFKFQKKFILMKLWKCWFTYINQQLNALQADLIIPVPMHKEKLKIRGFNQTSFLARILAKVSKIDYGRNILYKIKDTPNQRDLSQLERANNLLDAFSIEPNKAKMLIGKNILLIDDIVTTGATVNECAKVLLQFGASKVNVLTIARRQLRY